MSKLPPVITDHYLAARAYYGSVVGLWFLEGLPRLAFYLYAKTAKGKAPATQLRRQSIYSNSITVPQDSVKNDRHWITTVWLHKALTSSLSIPFMRSYHVSDVLRFVAFLGLNILFATQENEYSTDYTLYGWLTIANAGLALLLAARSNLFTMVLRLPSSVALQYHRWIGIATVAQATTHISYNLQRYIVTEQIATIFTSRRIQVGLMAWICLSLIFISALPIVRRRLFEVFYYTHFLFLVFIGGAYYHSTSGAYSTKGIEFLTVGLTLWVVDRVIRFFYNFRKITVEKVTHYEGGLAKIKCTGMRAGNPGQIAWIQLSHASYVNWHPFTIATVTHETRPMTTIAVRSLGTYTTAVQKLPEADTATEAKDKRISLRLDGPYGVGRFNWGNAKLSVLVAGGVGITPSMSIASNIILNAATRNKSGVQHVHLLWTVKDVGHISWFENELCELFEISERDGSNSIFRIDIYVSQSNRQADRSSTSFEKSSKPGLPSQPAADPWKISQGRPDLLSWFNDIQSTRPGQDALVNACGPESLIRDARKACVNASSRSSLFYIEEEVFEL